MAKVKNRKRISVDKIQKKRQNQNAKKPLNPFEVHINKETMRVLGQKLKNEKGLPGFSRAKAIQKRKQTLLHEYKFQHKSNKFMDKRIREKSQMTQEEKAIARFAAVRIKAHNKKTIDNPEENFNLTHKSQSLGEIEKYDFHDVYSDDEESEDENKSGKLGSTFVQDAHFGGELFKNSGKEGIKTHRQLIEQLIEESKKRKAEKQKNKEATMELTEKLDSEWKELAQLVNTNTKKGVQECEKPKLDEYDKVMRELKFEARGTVSDRLKTEDEIVKEEKDKLEKLEQERLERMKDINRSNSVKLTHRSADDLDDDFVYESDGEKNMLSYDQEGQSNIQVQAQVNGKILGEENAKEHDNSKNYSDKEDVEEEEENESSSEDSLVDLKENDESDEDSEIEINTVQSKTSSLKAQSTVKRSGDILLPDNGEKKLKIEKSTPQTTNIKLSETEKKELEKAENELPFTFNLPKSYESFMEIFRDRSINHQKVILERMIKCNHPSLSQGNKEGLGIVFQYLLQYLNDIFSDVEESAILLESFNTFKALMPHIYDLAQLNKENTHNSILAVIKEKHQDYRKKKKKFPSLEIIPFLKLVSLLFSTSDFRHQVVTPCLIFMEQMLRYCTVKSAENISYGLLLCTLTLEFTFLSKRYLPSTINFLSGVLHMAIPKTSVRMIKVQQPFRPLSNELVLTKNCSNLKVDGKLPISKLVENEMTDGFKISALYVTMKLLRDFIENLSSLSSSCEIFHKVEEYIHQIPMEFYPEVVKMEHKEICDSLRKLKSDRQLRYLIMEAKKPMALRLYEPKIVEIYDGKRHKVQSKEKAEKAKLLHKLKKETKGALREIRRDNAFLGRLQVTQKIKSDKERQEKVNRIFSEAATQQSELNALDRKNKKK